LFNKQVNFCSQSEISLSKQKTQTIILNTTKEEYYFSWNTLYFL